MLNLIGITKEVIGNEEVNAVSARELHKALGYTRNFSRWIEAFTEGDAYPFTLLCDFVAHSCAGKKADYMVSLDMAKHMAMVSKTEVGFEIRQYFIDIEKKYRAEQKLIREQHAKMARMLTEQSRESMSKYYSIAEYLHAKGFNYRAFRIKNLSNMATQELARKPFAMKDRYSMKWGRIRTFSKDELDKIFPAMISQ